MSQRMSGVDLEEIRRDIRRTVQVNSSLYVYLREFGKKDYYNPRHVPVIPVNVWFDKDFCVVQESRNLVKHWWRDML